MNRKTLEERLEKALGEIDRLRTEIDWLKMRVASLEFRPVDIPSPIVPVYTPPWPEPINTGTPMPPNPQVWCTETTNAGDAFRPLSRRGRYY